VRPSAAGEAAVEDRHDRDDSPRSTW
jgi:hypothetical protein